MTCLPPPRQFLNAFPKASAAFQVKEWDLFAFEPPGDIPECLPGLAFGI
jgi:hypothetical protein